MNLLTWAIQYAIPYEAIADLQRQLGQDGPGADPGGESEAAAQAAVRLEAARKGVRLWRNNNGAYLDENGRMVRYGLANSSKAENKLIASADLIGIRPVLITPGHVGQTIGQFVSREMKKPGWSYTGKSNEPQQQRWALLVAAAGGDASFCTGPGTL